MMLADELVRLAPDFQIAPNDRPQAASLGERILKTEQSRYDKIEFASGLYRKAIDTLHGIDSDSVPMGLGQSFVGALAAMPILKDSRWKPWIAEQHLPTEVEALSGWDADAFQSFPTIADNPAAAAALAEMPEVASLNLLVDHIVAQDYQKPVFHQPTRDPVRNALFTSVKKEGEQQGLKWENIDFYYVIGGNKSAHVCMPVDTVKRIFNRMVNILQFPRLAQSDAVKAATLSNYADIRLKKIKTQSDLTKTMTKADRATDNFRVGAQMLKFMSNLGQFDRLVSLDLEGWELGCHNITELGFSVYQPAKKALTAHHYIIEENRHLKNGNIMPNHINQFVYGQSVVKPLKEAYQILCDTIKRGQNVAIVGHGIQSDIQMILDAGLDKLPREACTKIDTQTLFLQINRCAENSRLETVLEHFKLPTTYLHNAGNDAFCTLLVCLRLAGEDIDSHVQELKTIG